MLVIHGVINTCLKAFTSPLERISHFACVVHGTVMVGEAKRIGENIITIARLLVVNVLPPERLVAFALPLMFHHEAVVNLSICIRIVSTEVLALLTGHII